ncbi:PREDICTED: CCG-binding 1 [Prunus dulcis]|uniref:PREDICTED: CCG-binding 1 n=1 Tax=Prunus dulcis TaxID=3755 RepID=A0A5E4EHG0_PRUDU|nr:CCG-binding protein 1 [Prunus dulcis]VVA15235.1 PREDICTED: CCG-binding 1 [Prunus dulcis]
MIKTVMLRSCPSSSPLLFEANREAFSARASSPSSSSTTPKFASIICCSSRNHAYIPKLEPFSRSKLDRAIRDPPLIEKCENELSDYCSTLEGDESYGCWRAYFELKDLEKEIPKQDVEKLILQAGGVKTLVGCLHGIAAIKKDKKLGFNSAKPSDVVKEGQRLCPIPDGLPKSAQELEEEESSRMPDSPFTRLLRIKGRHPAWYSATPDHETD